MVERKKRVHSTHHKKESSSHHKKDSFSFELPDINKKALKSMNSILIVSLAVLVLISAFFAVQANAALSEKVASLEAKAIEAEEASKPATLELIQISAADCADCASIEQTLSAIRALEDEGRANLTVTSLQANSSEAQKIISDYGITKLPTFIIQGEVNRRPDLQKLWTQIGRVTEDETVVFTANQAPYYDLAQDRVYGVVNAVVLTDESCEDCYDVSAFVESLTSAGLILSDTTSVDVSSKEGKDLIEQYELTKAPTFILTGDVEAFPRISQSWTQLGSVEEDGAHVYRNVTPLYFDLEEDRVVGYVDVTYLTASDCESCYDVHSHDQILQSMGMVFNETTEVDYSSENGQALIAQYGVTKLPTVILTGDADAYPTLLQVWPNVGIVNEETGALVFTKPEVVGWSYYDLETNSEVTPTR